MMQDEFGRQLLNGLVPLNQVMVDMEFYEEGEGSDTEDDEDVPMRSADFRAIDFPASQRGPINVLVGLDYLASFRSPLQRGQARASAEDLKKLRHFLKWCAQEGLQLQPTATSTLLDAYFHAGVPFRPEA